jgi:hypothetical protein
MNNGIAIKVGSTVGACLVERIIYTRPPKKNSRFNKKTKTNA